ncbi:MAG: hypothetical protein AAGI01_10520 [Myxococcota bacterium]
MRFIITALTTATLALTCVAQADAKGGATGGTATGIGLGATGDTQGLSLRRNQGVTSAQLVVGRWVGPAQLGVAVDGLYHFSPIVSGSLADLALYAGLGVGVGVIDDFGFNASGAIGLELNLVPLPLNFALSWRPTLSIVPDTNLALQRFGGHVRFFF